jgi:hypothetical protein
MLGLFLEFRARHLENTNRMSDAEPDYLLARYLFPTNRYLYIAQNQVSVQCSMNLFEPHEKGHPVELAHWLQDVVRKAPWIWNAQQKQNHEAQQSTQQSKEKKNGKNIDALFQEAFVD